MTSYDNRQSVPQVYNYGGNANTSYIQGQNPGTTNVYRTSNVEQVNPTRPVTITNNNVANTNVVNRTSQVKGSRAQEVVSANKRFENYHHN